MKIRSPTRLPEKWWLSVSCFLMANALLGCAAPKIRVPIAQRQASALPDAWKNVSLAYVKGIDNPDLGHYVLGAPPTVALETILKQRLPNASIRQPTVLRVENVRARVVGKTAGVAADFVLQRGDEGKMLRLEHSVTFASSHEGIYTRALYDLTDRLLFHRDALAFLSAPAAPLEDSARVDEPEDRGPMLALKPSSPGLEASGRFLWGEKDESNGFGGIAMLGETKAFLGLINHLTLKRYVGYGYSMGLGAAFAKGASPTGESSTTTMFMYQVNLHGGVGYNTTKYDDKGYVRAPGVTVLIGPSVGGMSMMTGSMTLTGLQYGGQADLDLPLGDTLGFRGGVFVGGSTFATRISMDPRPSQSYTSTSFAWFPHGDLYFQTATGRTSLGLSFQSLQDAKSFLKNPMLVFTWEGRVGRGIAYSKESLMAGDTSLYRQDQILSAPANAFGTGGTLPPPPTLIDPAFAGQAIAAPTQPVAAPAPVAPPTVPAGPESRLKGKKIMALEFQLDPSLGPETASFLEGILAALATKMQAELIPPRVTTKLAQLAGITDLTKQENILAASKSLEAALCVGASLQVLEDKSIRVQVWLLDPGTGTRNQLEKSVVATALPTAYREIVQLLLDSSQR